MGVLSANKDETERSETDQKMKHKLNTDVDMKCLNEGLMKEQIKNVQWATKPFGCLGVLNCALNI